MATLLRSSEPPARHRAGASTRAGGAVLVTGMPRSGTTWLARLIALSPGSALAGREPMNPRGRQYALGGTVDGWARLTEPTARQQRVMRRAHRGLTPMVYSRYGMRQWAAPLPGTRLVVKDPFAMLSVPATVAATGAQAVLVYRHPGAMLASYRRMGWLPDVEELAPVAAAYEARRAPGDPAAPPPRPDLDPASPEAMGWFWNALYAMAFADLKDAPTTLVVAHEDVAGGGEAPARKLVDALGMKWSAAHGAEVGRESAASPEDAAHSTALHVFDRAPSEVAQGWRRHVPEAEVEAIEAVTDGMRALLHERRLVP